MKEKTQNQKILLTGGGSGGSTAPLIAIYQALVKKGDFEFRWIGTKNGPEKTMVSQYGLNFVAFPAAKLRRYFAWKNFVEPLVFAYALIRALFFLTAWRPDIILSTGAFVSVPIVIAGWFLRIPALIHQQDIKPTLSNMIMAPFATKITLSFPEQSQDFAKAKIVLTGNPVRAEFIKIKEAAASVKQKCLQRYKFSPNLPLLLVIGGGLGSRQINELVLKCLYKLTEFCQVAHVTGKGNKLQVTDYPPASPQLQPSLDLSRRGGRGEPVSPKAAASGGLGRSQVAERYHQFEFLTGELPEFLFCADVVVSRAGMSFLSELAVLGKPTIIIPMPDSHQRQNADYFKRKNAAITLDIPLSLTGQDVDVFCQTAKSLLADRDRQKILSDNIQSLAPPGAADKIAEEIIRLL